MLLGFLRGIGETIDLKMNELSSWSYVQRFGGPRVQQIGATRDAKRIVGGPGVYEKASNIVGAYMFDSQEIAELLPTWRCGPYAPTRSLPFSC